MNIIRKGKKVLTNLKHLPGWKTKRKIVVFESDDWGSIRMPSREVYDNCIKSGYRVDENIFDKYDSLASEEDLELLFELLKNYKDKNGNNPVFTGNCLVTNPNFRKIKESKYEKYYYELITETFKSYPKHTNNLKLWQKAREEKVFFPQSHGREHLNVSRFMNDLKKNKNNTMFAFDNKMPGIFELENRSDGNNYVVSLEHYDEDDKNEKNKIIIEGLKIFEKLFGYKSESFIATNYVWNKELECLLKEEGVKTLQGSITQLVPKGEFKGFRKKYNYIGKINQKKQIYLTRNVYFEPSFKENYDWVDSNLNMIQKIFSWNKPAIISTHRINYVGYIFKENRDRTLKMLNELLKQMLVKWPDIEFMTSVELGNLILKEKEMQQQ